MEKTDKKQRYVISSTYEIIFLLPSLLHVELQRAL
jgi:hypothetical protein